MLELLVSAVIVGIVITIVSIAIGYYNEKKKRHINNRKAVKPFRERVKKDTQRTDYPAPHNSSIQGTDAFLYMILTQNDIFNSTKPSEDILDERGHSDFGNGGSFGGGGASGSFDTDSSSSYDKWGVYDSGSSSSSDSDSSSSYDSDSSSSSDSGSSSD